MARANAASSPVSVDVSNVVDRARVLVGQMQSDTRSLTIALFDLSASVSMKVENGHSTGTNAGLLHNTMCRMIVNAHGGVIIKELGDGVFCSFDDPLQACLAAIEVKQATEAAGLTTKGSLGMGVVERVQINGNTDLFGTAVDRCARLLSAAMPGQMLLDRSLHEAAQSFFRDMKELKTGPALPVFLRGYGNTEAHELVSSIDDLQGTVFTPFALHEHGELSPDEVLTFIQTARSEVIDLGVGLVRFAARFEDRARPEWTNCITALLQSGVTVRAAALDPDWPATSSYLVDQGQFGYLERIYGAIRALKRQQEAFRPKQLSGNFELVLYRQMPSFAAVCVDPEEPSAGRLLVASHLPGIGREETPVIQVSRRSNPELFQKYWKSIKHLLRDARPQW